MCKHWPPYYEKYVNGKCVEMPPQQQSSKKYDIIGLGLVALVVCIPIFVLATAKSN